jgi:hypothetical protein
MPGWTILLEDGHSETLSAQLVFRRAGNQTDGPITLRGNAGAATMPLLTFSNNSAALAFAVNFCQLQHFEMRNTNATKTASLAVTSGTNHINVEGLKINHSTNRFWKGINCSSNTAFVRVIGCTIGYTASFAIDCAVVSGALILNNYLHDTTAVALRLDAAHAIAKGNIFARAGTHGISLQATTTLSWQIVNNTFVGCGTDGIAGLVAMSTGPLRNVLIANNIFAWNGGYGINLAHTSSYYEAMDATHWQILNNVHYGNTSGWLEILGGSLGGAELAAEEGTINIDPRFTSPLSTSTHDFTVNTPELRQVGYPRNTNIGTYVSTTKSYITPGAAGRADERAAGVAIAHA